MSLLALRILRGSRLAGAALVVVGSPVAFAQTQDNSSSKSASVVEEVIVTAEKRPEAVRSISGSVSAFSDDQLEMIGAQSLEDYLSRTPGVIFNAQMPGNSSVTIRGVSTTTSIAQGQGSVGYFIDDVPLTDPSYSVATPDIDTFDVQNVSVARGPQGTLFGASSLSGAINYEAAKPDVTDFGMHVQGTAESVDHGAFGGSGKVMLNVPIISDTFALRGVYIYRSDPGFIDNVGTGQKDSNRTLIRGGRIEALWQVGPKTTINYLYLNQSEDTPDLGYDEPQLVGNLHKTTVVPETTNFGTEIHNLRVDQDLSFATLTATATYHEKTQFALTDYTALFGGFFPGASSVTLAQPAKSTGETFEVRLASPAGQTFEYVAGLYYDDTTEKISNIGAGDGIQQSIINNYGYPATDNIWLDAYVPFQGIEEAAFGDLTYHIDDQWKVEFGGRLFSERVGNESKSSGFYVYANSGVPTIDEFGHQKASGFNPKGSITWRPNDDFMAYALISKGFRFGGPNVSPSTPGAPVPASYGSDSLINYEIGVRSNLFDNKLQLDATVFYIDWSNIQLELQTPTHLNYATNAGAAANAGLELSANWLVTDDLTFTTNLTYLDAHLTEDFNPGGGQPIVPRGTVLPGASKWIAANSLVYNLKLGPLNPEFILSNRFISRAPGGLQYGIPQGGYDLVDARVSLPWENYSVALFVTNIGDVRGVTSGFAAALVGTDQRFLVQPRTIGITVDYKM